MVHQLVELPLLSWLGVAVSNGSGRRAWNLQRHRQQSCECLFRTRQCFTRHQLQAASRLEAFKKWPRPLDFTPHLIRWRRGDDTYLGRSAAVGRFRWRAVDLWHLARFNDQRARSDQARQFHVTELLQEAPYVPID